ncbi:rhodanese-like domain-containing protein [Litchfieldia alkalitelluris]|uniref:rhodanese-like domain-containing protein n=1 Tax=Litchfieldia alkalitelluris TaxID=304268 RepID=UPI000996094A|nr:rhodanese-like domain-containing protein [Litchfieldia alkalitelluris]
MRIKTIVIYLPIVFLILYFGYTQFENKSIKTISTTELAQKLEDESSSNTIFVDVREPHEFEAGHIKEMKNIPLSTLKTDYKSLSKDAEIVLFCRSGKRSLQAANILKDYGYSNVVSVNGGIQAWQGEVVK